MSRIDETRTGLSADTVTEPCPDPVAKPDGAPRPVWHLTVAYDGAAYHGWQVQPGVVTVQEILQEKLRRLFLAPELTLSATSRA